MENVSLQACRLGPSCDSHQPAWKGSALYNTWRLIAVIKCLWRLTSICAT